MPASRDSRPARGSACCLQQPEIENVMTRHLDQKLGAGQKQHADSQFIAATEAFVILAWHTAHQSRVHPSRHARIIWIGSV